MRKPGAVVLGLAALSTWTAGDRLDAASAVQDPSAVSVRADTPAESSLASVTGRVLVRAPAADPPPAMSPYARRRPVPPQDPGTPGGAEDAFVYLESTGGAVTPRDVAPARIGQSDRTITPHVSAVQVGQLVEFPNDDDVFHNLFSLSSGNRFSLGRYAPGTTESNRFEQPGVVRLFCDIHAEMAGVILVVETHHLTRVQNDGAYVLTEVPPGMYRAIAWHPTAGADTVMLSVGDGEETADFLLGGGS